MTLLKMKVNLIYISCLRVYFRGCNYNMDTFKVKFDLFYTIRGLLPEWFDNWDTDLEEVKTALNAGFIVPIRGEEMSNVS